MAVGGTPTAKIAVAAAADIHRSLVDHIEFTLADPEQAADGLDELGHRDRLRQIGLATECLPLIVAAKRADPAHSVFQNSDMMAVGELALLESFRGKVPDEVFGEPFLLPVSDGSGQDLALLRKGSALLQEAGFNIKDGKRVTPQGEPISLRRRSISKPRSTCRDAGLTARWHHNRARGSRLCSNQSDALSQLHRGTSLNKPCPCNQRQGAPA